MQLIVRGNVIQGETTTARIRIQCNLLSTRYLTRHSSIELICMTKPWVYKILPTLVVAKKNRSNATVEIPVETCELWPS